MSLIRKKPAKLEKRVKKKVIAAAEMTAGECKTSEILYCYATDEAEEVLKNMAENKVRRVPVLDNVQNKRLVGVISFGDLSAICENKQASGKAMEKIRES